VISVLGAAAADRSVWNDLLAVIFYGLVAGLGIAVMFSIAIRGLVTAAAARRAGQSRPALLWGGVGIVGVLTCLAAVGLGLVTMLSR